MSQAEGEPTAELLDERFAEFKSELGPPCSVSSALVCPRPYSLVPARLPVVLEVPCRFVADCHTTAGALDEALPQIDSEIAGSTHCFNRLQARGCVVAVG